MVGPVFVCLLVASFVGYVHWVSVPRAIAHIESVARRIPTTQIENLARVETLERWRIILRGLLVVLLVITFLLARVLLGW